MSHSMPFIGGICQATPCYNSSILEDMFIEENVEIVEKTFHERKSLREALILLKVRSGFWWDSSTAAGGYKLIPFLYAGLGPSEKFHLHS